MADYRILSVSRLTGVPADTIRKWERRYGAVNPRRDARGVRRYSELDLHRLRELRAALDLGYPIGEAVLLPPAALAKIIAEKLPVLKERPDRARTTRADSFTRAVVRGLERYDGEQIDRMLSAAAHLLPPSEFVLEVMSPLFQQIGTRWRRGTMEIEQEHLFSAIARSILGGLIRRHATRGDARLVLFTTLAGEPHEFGVLLAAMLAASEGLRPYYLGPNVPAAAIARAAAEVKAGTVVVGAARSRNKATLRRTIDALASGLPAGTDLWLGGRAAEHVTFGRHGQRISAVPTLQEFYDRIRLPAISRPIR
jgi:methanogenic corrinoid protein MtbC1